jgi:hypothetical protein
MRLSSIASLLLVSFVTTACPISSKEIGATIGDSNEGSGSAGSSSSGSTGDGGDATVGSLTDTGSSAADQGDGDGSDTGVSDDGSSGLATSGDTEDACFDAWAQPIAVTTAPSRPSTPGMRANFEYADGVVTLVSIADEQIVQPSEGPFSPEKNSGTWIELRDASDTTIYTRGFFELIPEAVEVFDPPSWIPQCPGDGSLFLPNLDNAAAATQLVFFQEAVDGEMTLDTIELMRFDLP